MRFINNVELKQIPNKIYMYKILLDLNDNNLLQCAGTLKPG